jgi:beta-glucosidase
MKTIKTLGVLLMVSFAATASLSSVAVDSLMLHGPNAGLGVNYCGAVQYSLAPEAANDSMYVSITINPAAGGSNLTLTEVRGDIGLIHVNTNTPTVAKTYTIFFQASDAVPGVYYIAHITANANPSRTKIHSDSLIAVMSKTQEATLCGGNGNMEALASSPIPAIYMADGPHGVRGNGNATCFPTCAGLCNTWDTACAYLQGQAKGEEFRALGRNCSLGPAGDLVYHPQGGRASEYYGEDPYLSGRMMAADALGLQSRGVIATIKHYACNNKEQNRTTMSAAMSERSMREIYLYNWQPSVMRSQCWGVMSAYNRLSTPSISYAGSNRYIQSTVMREEWAYKFLVMTDWGGNFDNYSSGLSWGSDIDMPSPDVYTVSNVTSMSDSIVSVHARRIILAHEMLGDMVAGYNRTAYASSLLSAAHTKVVRDNGAAGIILAKNTNNLLPIAKTGKTIAITGPYATTCRLGPGGSSAVTPPTSARITPTQGINNLLAGVGSGASTITTNLNTADYILVFVGVTGETEGSDRPSLAVTSQSETDVSTALAATNGPNKTVVIFTGGSAASAGVWSTAPAILIAFYPGQEQGNSMADVLFGDVNPSGKLGVTFPQDASQLPNFTLVSSVLTYPRQDTAHGYFRMDKRGTTPLFWFGHGQSYTTFSYSNLQVYPASIKAGDIVRVRVTVTNTGSVAGKEVVQLYLSMPTINPSLPVRVQDLRGFKKVSLNPGANTTVDFQFTAEEMRVYNPNGTDYANNGHNGIWTVLSGTYGVRVGTSADRTATPSLSGSFIVQ